MAWHAVLATASMRVKTMKFAFAFHVILSFALKHSSAEGHRLTVSYIFRGPDNWKSCRFATTLSGSAAVAEAFTSTTRSPSPSPWIVLRGGAAASSAPKKTGNPAPKEGFDLDDVRQVLGSLVDGGKRLWCRRVVPFVHSRILPVIQHPDTHIIHPLQDFLYNQTMQAKQRREPVIQSPDTQIVRPLQGFRYNHTMEVMQRLEPVIHHPDTPIVPHLQYFLRNQTMEAKQRREQYYKASRTTAGMAVLLKPGRMLKLCVVSWLLAEGLAWMGILWEKGGRKSIRKLKALGENNCSRIRAWWISVRKNPERLWTHITSLEPRYQWAVGATLGMILSPTLWSIAGSGAKLGVIFFVIGEINRFLRQNNVYGRDGAYRHSGEDDDLQEDGTYLNNLEFLIRRIDAALESWCQLVRAFLDNPLRSLELVTQEVDTKLQRDLSMPANVRKGLFVGVVLGMIAGV